MKQTLALFLLFPLCLVAQNFVVNPDFENIEQPVSTKTSIDIADGWSSPNAGSPELIGSNAQRYVHDPYGSNWKFRAKSGSHVAGMNVYGGNGSRPIDHTRAYIQGSLSTPLTIGKKYYFSFWVHYHCEGANNIGITFLPEKLSLSSSGQIDLMPAAWQHEVTPYSTTKTWTQVVDSFIAYQSYRYFIIGNFFSDTETEVQNSPLGHHFAYIDNVAVMEARNLNMPPALVSRGGEEERPTDWSNNIRQLEEIKRGSAADSPAEVETSSWSAPTTIAGIEELFTSTVYFDLDQYQLDSGDKLILDKLAKGMTVNPDLRIMALGFTSGEGGNSYNFRLSDLRARAVRSYLLDKEIAPERVIIRALGENSPAVVEDSELKRARNRRVEFRILW